MLFKVNIIFAQNIIFLFLQKQNNPHIGCLKYKNDLVERSFLVEKTHLVPGKNRPHREIDVIKTTLYRGFFNKEKEEKKA